jgi:hypothetical protein
MKSHTEYLTFDIPARMDLVNITPQVEAIVHRSGVQEGLCLCNAMQNALHTLGCDFCCEASCEVSQQEGCSRHNGKEQNEFGEGSNSIPSLFERNPPKGDCGGQKQPRPHWRLKRNHLQCSYSPMTFTSTRFGLLPSNSP